MNNNDKFDKEEVDNKKKKISFFKKVIISVKDFDKYEIFAKESLGQAMFYLLAIVIIITLLSIGFSMNEYIDNCNNLISVLDSKIETLTYQNNTLSINNNEKTEITDLKNSVGTIIIDTSELSDEQKEEYKNSNNTDQTIILLNDEIIIKNIDLVLEPISSDYKSFLQDFNLNGDSYSKQELVNDYNNVSTQLYIEVFFNNFYILFIVYFLSILSDVVILGALGWLTARIIRIKMRYSATFNIAVHALTLPIILNIIYMIVNGITGYNIKYFQIMYTAIAYIYVATAIFMIKSDYMKQQLELQKIESVQEKVREELERKEQERKNKEEKERLKKEPDKENDKKDKTRNKKDKKPGIAKNPEGNNA